MSEVPFGLKRQPFKAAASGVDVFVGPQTAKVMQSTKKALSSPDAVVAVIGPAGTGKTTLVKRALGTISGDKQVIHVARMHLGHDEVLELLLDAVGATDIPASTLKQFRMFQQFCRQKVNAGIRPIILVEDAVRIGEDALAELEALTAADGFDNGGANLVLMGDASLGKLLHTESLARLRQRLRLYQKVQPLAPAEMQGYLKHCFRMAGGEFDLLFDDAAATYLHSLSAGVPRIVNNLVDSVLAAASESGVEKIDLGIIREVAEDQYGLTADLPETPEPASKAVDTDKASPPAGTPATARPAAAGRPEAADAGKDAPEVVKKAERAAPQEDEPARAASEPPRPDQAPSAAPAPKQEPEPAVSAATPGSTPAAGADAAESLELVQDTLPDLAILAPEIAGSPADKAGTEREDIPTLFSSQTVDTGKRASAKVEPPAGKPKPDEPGSKADSAPETKPKPATPAEATNSKSTKPAKATAATQATQPKQERKSEAKDARPAANQKQAPTGSAKAAQPAAPQQPAAHAAVQASRQQATSAKQARPQTREQSAGDTVKKSPKQPVEARPATSPTRAEKPQTSTDPKPAGGSNKPESQPSKPVARPTRTAGATGADKPQPQRDSRPAKAAAEAASRPGGGAAGKKAAAGDAAASAKPAKRPAPATATDEDKPDWDRDPTLAELRPDFDALEQAMAEFAEPESDATASKAPAEPNKADKDEVVVHDPTVPVLPEITLDSAIEERIAEETAARDRTDGPRPGDDVPIEAAVGKPDSSRAGAGNGAAQKAAESTRADEELERIAAGLARARTIEDVDDKMAETLFGEEFSAIAAQIAANPPPEYLEALAESSQPEEKPAAAGADSSSGQKPAKDEPKSELEQQFMEVYGEDAVNVDLGAEDRHAGLDLSASQRLATVRALNADGSNDAGSAESAEKRATPAGPPPAPIEDQITTSMTQTMRTLQASAPPANDDGDDDERKGGFFSRFRRS